MDCFLFCMPPVSHDVGSSLCSEGKGGIILAAEHHDDIHEGDLLMHINGKVVLGKDGKTQDDDVMDRSDDNAPVSSDEESDSDSSKILVDDN